MGADTKIIGWRRAGGQDQISPSADDHGACDDDAPVLELTAETAIDDADAFAADTVDADGHDWAPIEDDALSVEDAEAPRIPYFYYLGMGLLLALASGWSSWFAYMAMAQPLATLTSPTMALLIAQWAAPMVLLAVLALWLQRSSLAEARRYRAATRQLRTEADTLEQSLSRMGQQLQSHYALLHEQSVALDQLGSEASRRLIESASHMEQALEHSQFRAEQLNEVAIAGNGNLDRLRKQIPMVTNLTKDIVNSIADAGVGAAQQVESLSYALAKVQQSATESGQLLQQLSSDSLNTAATVGQQSEAMVQQLQGHLHHVAAQVEDYSTRITEASERSGEALVARFAEADVRADALLRDVQTAEQRLADMAEAAMLSVEQRATQTLGAVGQQLSDAAGLWNAQWDNDAVKAETRIAALGVALESLNARLTDQLDSAMQGHQAMFVRAEADIGRLIAQLSDGRTTMGHMGQEASESLQAQLDQLAQAIQSVASIRYEESQLLQQQLAELDQQYHHASERVATLADHGSEQSARLAFALAATHETIEKLSLGLSDNDQRCAAMIERGEALSRSLRDNLGLFDTELQPLATRYAEQIQAINDMLSRQAEDGRDMEMRGDRLIAQYAKLDRQIEAQQTLLSQLEDSSQRALSTRGQDIADMAARIAEVREQLSLMRDESESEMAGALDRIARAADEAVTTMRGRLVDMHIDDNDIDSMFNINRLTEQADAHSARAREIMAQAIDANLTLTEAHQEKMAARLTQLQEMTSALEARVETARTRFDAVEDEGFARRMAMLTEALNSASIDIAKILSNEVTDTAWAAYLKGDRGVFTRRAVRLLDGNEARVIADYYDVEPEFRAQVNRYIHDFESMMRSLLSTRDGHTISVALLSSDVGKLYVALAQAIERLRT